MTESERRESLDFHAGGSWTISTESGSHYQLLLDGDDKRIIRLAVDTGRAAGRRTRRGTPQRP